MNKNQIKFLFLIFIISIAASLVFFITCSKYSLTGDAEQYDAIGLNLAQGNGYSMAKQAPYAPTMIREPVYPFFLASIYRIFGHRLHAVYLVQILLFAVSCVFVYLIAKELFNEQVARYSAVLTALCPTLANFAVLLYSDSFFFFLLMVTTYYLIRTKLTMRLTRFVICGILLGLLTLCKGVMIFIFILFMAYLWINESRVRGFVKRYLIRMAVLLMGLSLTVAPWIGRNYRTFGISSLNSLGDLALLSRAYRSEYSGQKMMRSAVYYFSEYLGGKFFPDAFNKPSEAMLEQGYILAEREEDLLRQGYGRREINATFREEAIAIIRSHPVKYVLTMPLELLRLAQFMYIPALNQPFTIDRFEEIKNGDMILSLIRGIYKISVYPLLILAFCGIYFDKNMIKKSFFPISIILYLNFIYCLLSGYPRYNVPLIPFYLMFAIVAVIKIIERRK